MSSDDLINIIKQSALKGRVDIPNGKKLKAGGISMPSLSADEVEKLTLAKREFIPLNVVHKNRRESAKELYVSQ
ncbi:MAG: hypothetical protein GX372_04795 [Ignavibacteria bacterium]|jgi:hypothetical protein|nr:hypothetical protein [Ignavibacteria bacterium]